MRRAFQCGCDPEECYVCRAHAEALEKAVEAFVAPEYEDATDVEELPASGIDAIIESARAVNYETARRLRQNEATTLLDARFWKSAAMQERAIVIRVSEILATFYRAPLSMSSVAPILALAEELNPGLKETK